MAITDWIAGVLGFLLGIWLHLRWEQRHGDRSFVAAWAKRLYLAWTFRVWPWHVPWQATLVSLKRPTPEDIQRVGELFHDNRKRDT